MHQLIFEETQYSTANAILGTLVIAGLVAAIVFLWRFKNRAFRLALIATVPIGIFSMSIVSTMRLKTLIADGKGIIFIFRNGRHLLLVS